MSHGYLTRLQQLWPSVAEKSSGGDGDKTNTKAQSRLRAHVEFTLAETGSAGGKGKALHSLEQVKRSTLS